MSKELTELIEDLRLNHEYCPKEVILQAAEYLEILSKRTWVGLTDEELLQAYGWKLASGAPNFILEEAKQELLGALRKVESKLKERNT